MTNEEIVMKIKSGELGAEGMLQLFENNSGMVKKMIRPYLGFSDERDAEREEDRYTDLKQEVFLSLYPTVDRFDPEKGYKFLTYWTREAKKALQDYARKTATIPLSSDVTLEVLQYRKALEEFRLEYGREPSDMEMVDFGDYANIEAVKRIRRIDDLRKCASLDAPAIAEDSESETLGELQPDPGPGVEEQITDRILQEEIRRELWEVVDELPEKQAEVLRMKYREGMSGSEIGEALGISRQACNRLEHSGCDRIRSSNRGKSLRRRCIDGGLLYWNAVGGTGFGIWSRTGYSAPERIAISSVEGLDDSDTRWW